MTRIIVWCEGPTEELFVSRILAPHLGQRGTWITAKSMGGIKAWEAVQRQLIHLADGDCTAWITTMLDLYGLKKSFPEFGNRAGDAVARVERIEDGMRRTCQGERHPRRIRPFICLHEFESLLFSEPAAFGILPDSDQAVADFGRLVATQAPETINDGPTTAPSRRIKDLISRYSKPTDGLQVAQRIGLDTMRQRCPHFATWLSWLESPT